MDRLQARSGWTRLRRSAELGVFIVLLGVVLIRYAGHSALANYIVGAGVITLCIALLTAAREVWRILASPDERWVGGWHTVCGVFLGVLGALVVLFSLVGIVVGLAKPSTPAPSVSEIIVGVLILLGTLLAGALLAWYGWWLWWRSAGRWWPGLPFMHHVFSRRNGRI